MIHTYLVRYYQFDFGFLPYPIWIGVYDLVSTRYLYLVRATCVALVYEDETAMFGFANFHFLTKLFKTTALKSEKLPYLCTTVSNLHYKIYMRLHYINMNSRMVSDFHPVH